MGRVYGFYHICMIRNWKIVVREQITKLVRSGLYQRAEWIMVSLVGQDLAQWELFLTDMQLELNLSEPLKKFCIGFSSTNTQNYERDVIKLMQAHASSWLKEAKSPEVVEPHSIKANIGASELKEETKQRVEEEILFYVHSETQDKKTQIETKSSNSPSPTSPTSPTNAPSQLSPPKPISESADVMFYLHSKGVTSTAHDRKGIHDWRHLLEYFTIEKHELCYEKCQTHDTCGVNWRKTPRWHYSGNFWWARLDYVAKLIHIPPAPDYLGPEMWIGQGYPNYCCVFNSGIDHYLATFPQELYRQ